MNLTRRSLLTGTAVLGTSGLWVPRAEAARPRPTVGKVLARGMVVPWGVAFLPDGNALVTERRTAKVRLVKASGGRTTVGTITGVDVDSGEGGLLGCAASPNFPTNGHVFFYLTSGGDNRVIRMTYDGGGLSDRTVILSDIQRGARSHDGGRLAFGPDRKLYITTGDARDEPKAANLNSLAGKILRLNEDGSVPGDNPFDGNPVWTYGHRNVQGLAWDSKGRAYASEFGENTVDELNRIKPGLDYGWPASEGSDGPGGAKNPFVTWRPTSICSPSGVAIARGRAWVGALAGQSLYSVELRGPGKSRIRRHFRGRFGRIRSVEKAPDGSLWITTSNRDTRGNPSAKDDKVIRIDL